MHVSRTPVSSASIRRENGAGLDESDATPVTVNPLMVPTAQSLSPEYQDAITRHPELMTPEELAELPSIATMMAQIADPRRDLGYRLMRVDDVMLVAFAESQRRAKYSPRHADWKPWSATQLKAQRSSFPEDLWPFMAERFGIKG